MIENRKRLLLLITKKSVYRVDKVGKKKPKIRNRFPVPTLEPFRKFSTSCEKNSIFVCKNYLSNIKCTQPMYDLIFFMYEIFVHAAYSSSNIRVVYMCVCASFFIIPKRSPWYLCLDMPRHIVVYLGIYSATLCHAVGCEV